MVSPESKPTPRPCSVADALSVVGDRYALLVIRELLYGETRFNDIAAKIGAPKDVLTARLRKLEGAGLIERRQYCEHPPRYEYMLTPAGRDMQPVLLTLREWGSRHCQPSPDHDVFRHSCGEIFHPGIVCTACNEPLQPGSLSIAYRRDLTNADP